MRALRGVKGGTFGDYIFRTHGAIIFKFQRVQLHTLTPLTGAQAQ